MNIKELVDRIEGYQLTKDNTNRYIINSADHIFEITEAQQEQLIKYFVQKFAMVVSKVDTFSIADVLLIEFLKNTF